MANRPDFFIIGAPKCGTTSLYNWLKPHPHIFMPEEKEPHYFAQHLSNRYCRVRDEEAYLDLFAEAHDYQICGEASVLYSFFKKSIQGIINFNPTAKIIYMMRNPIEMVPSYHGQLLVNLEENIDDFETAWKAQQKRLEGVGVPKTSTDPRLLQYREVGALGRHLQFIAEMVPKDRLHIILLEDLAKNPKNTYQQVLNFLELEDDYREEFVKSNEAAALRSQYLQELKNKENGVINYLKPVLKLFHLHKLIEKFNRTQKKRKIISDDMVLALKRQFNGDIKIIEDFLNRDLTHWYK